MDAVRFLVVALALVLFTACGGPADPRQGAAAATVSAAGDVAASAATAPEIVNPAEELLEFAPDGILRWSAATGADAYELWAYRDAAMKQLQENSSALSARQYQFTRLAGGQTYYLKLYYRVSGSWRETTVVPLRTTTQVRKARLSNPQEELEAFGTTGVLRWSAVPGAERYEVWVYNDARLVSFAEASGPIVETQYQARGLLPGSTYHVQIYSLVGGTYYAGGALPVTVTPESSRARILNPQEELDAFSTTGILRWSPVTGATAYEVWVFSNPNSSVSYESSGSLTTRSYAMRTLQPASTYYVQVYAKVADQWQVGSPVRITTGTQVTRARLTTPQEDLERFSTTGTLRWSEVPGATRYELWVFTNAGLGVVAESGANPDRSYTVSRLCAGATYFVQVHAQVDGRWTAGWATRLDVTEGSSAADCVPPAPTVTLAASAAELLSGEDVTVTWSTKFADSCTASDGWAGTRPSSGTETFAALTSRKMFTLTCTNRSGSTRAQTLVTVAPTVSSITGSLLLGTGQQVDGDINDWFALYAANDAVVTAQRLPNPARVGGYVNVPGRGPYGRSQASGDRYDYFRVDLLAGQVIRLTAPGPDLTIPASERTDLDLYLANPNGIFIDVSAGTDSIEQLTVPAAGPYLVVVVATSGAATYSLSIGLSGAMTAAAGDLRLSEDFIGAQAIVRMQREASAAGAGVRKTARMLAAEYGLRQIAGVDGRDLLFRSTGSTRMKIAAAREDAEAAAGDLSFADEAQRTRFETLQLIKTLRRDPSVRWAEPNRILRASATPDDPRYSRQRWHYEMIALPAAWGVTTGSPDVVVAVVDSGVMTSHPDLVQRTVAGYDFISDVASAGDGDGLDADPTDPGTENSGTYTFHGTHVAGTIAAQGNDARGVAGVAWNVRLLPVRALGIDGTGTAYDVAQAVRFAAGLGNDSGSVPAKKADIVNLSLGAPGFCSPQVQALVDDVRAAGVVVVAAAGNAGSTAPATPASCTGVVSVAAVGPGGDRAPYSNHGIFVDVSAPGGDTSVDLDANGIADGVYSTWAQKNVDGYAPSYELLQGTSMAAPHVSGVIALMKGVRPSLTPADVDTLLLSGALTDDTGLAGRDEMGIGLINAFKAVTAASGTVSSAAPAAYAYPKNLLFGATTSEQELWVANVGGGSLGVSAITTSDARRIRVQATSIDAAGVGAYSVVLDRAGLANGSYEGWVDITTSAGSVRIGVAFVVSGDLQASNVGRLYLGLYDVRRQDWVSWMTDRFSGVSVGFEFATLPSSDYYIAAGSDMNNDGYICDAGEVCGWYPVVAAPGVIRARGVTTGIDFPVSFDASRLEDSLTFDVASGSPWVRPVRRSEPGTVQAVEQATIAVERLYPSSAGTRSATGTAAWPRPASRSHTSAPRGSRATP